MAVKSYGFESSSATGSSPNKDALESSAKTIDYHMQTDGSYSELMDCLKMGADVPAVSGLSDQDYPGVAELGIGFQTLSQLSIAKQTPLPPELVEQCGFMQVSCAMGLFPEIGRAWLAIDSNIFLWSFHDGSDLAYYDGITELIQCVGLAKPKAGVFQSFIHYLLCLSTPVEVVFLGVSFSSQSENNPYEEMHLLPEPLFRFPTDNIVMSCFASTDSGRIFMGAKDGCIYEFTYESGEGWFGKKCRKINHSVSALSFLVPTIVQSAFSKNDPLVQLAIDNSRNVLYSRSESGYIQVFDLGTDGRDMSRVASLSQQSIVNYASSVARTVDRKYFSPIVYIAAVEASESKHVHLIAVTSSGVRLYFSTNTCSVLSRPNSLGLLHVRLPPGFSANAVGDRPSNVDLALYRKGFFMMIASMVEEHDFLFTTSSDSFLLSNHLVETYTGMSIAGSAWALSEIPASNELRFKSAQTEVSVTDPPLLIVQHRESPRQFVILSNQGCTVLTKPRPVDHLRKLLCENKGIECEAVKAFFRLHGEAQACAMCLILACSKLPQDRQVAEWAARAFFAYGGSPQVNVSQSGDPGSSMESQFSVSEPLRPPVWASTPAQPEQSTSHGSALTRFSNVYAPGQPIASSSPHLGVSLPSPLISHQPQSPGLNITASAEVVFSPKHDALYLYFSRIMRPLWNLKIVYEQQIPLQPKTILCSTVPVKDLSELFLRLSALKDFMKQYHPNLVNVSNINITLNPPRPGGAQTLSHEARETTPMTSQLQPSSQNEAEVQERASLQNLQKFVSYTCEVLSLWKVLCDHPLETVLTTLESVDQEQLKQMAYKDIIVDGRELCNNLANALIHYYLEDEANTTAISQKLREVCPSIYKVEDATVSRAQEIVSRAVHCAVYSERQKALMEALKLSKSICTSLNLEAMCNLFRQAAFYDGVVDLCLYTAQKVDPQGLALHYYKNGEPPNDQKGLEHFTSRLACYKVIISTISELASVSRSHPQVASVPKTPGLQQSQKSSSPTPEEAERHSEFIFTLALKSDDELFHSALYDWMIENQQSDTLLAVKSHFLESYLKRRTTLQPDCKNSLDLLWKFYEKNQNFSAAARVLAKLADKSGADMNLAQRLEYLSRAIICVKSSEMRLSATGEGEFLHELEEKMEVARIQLQILEMLQRKTIPGIQDAIAKLNSTFLNITELYEQYAVPFDLPESKLAIVHCAGHYDPSLIESLWQSILDKELIGSCGNLPETRVKILQQKIQSLSHAYMNSEKYFPIAFIIKYLEFKTCTLNFSLDWVYNAMLLIGLPLADILGIYHKMYRSKDSCWLTVKKPLHLLQVLSSLIGEFVKNPTYVPHSERRAFVNLCLDVIAGYLVDLQAMSITDQTVSTLMKEFKAIQHNLERLVP